MCALNFNPPQQSPAVTCLSHTLSLTATQTQFPGKIESRNTKVSGASGLGYYFLIIISSSLSSPPYEVRLRTKFGEIVFNFDTLEELKSNIEELDVKTASEILWAKFESLVPTETRKPKPGFEKLYNFTPNGLVELALIPPALTKPELVAFVLFAYHPQAASTEQIFLSSGIRNAASDYLTHPNYKKFWWKTQDGTYVLGDEGLKWFFSKIVPKLTATTKEKAPAVLTEGTA